MSNLRNNARDDLKVVRDDWWIPVVLIAPPPSKTVYDKANGTENPLLGDVRYESIEHDPETGEIVMVKGLSITLLVADLTVIPQPDEKWFVKYPSNFLDSGTLVQAAFTPSNTDIGGDSMGWFKIRPQEADKV